MAERTDKKSSEGTDLPEHVESTVQAIANLHAQHEARANLSDQIVDVIRYWLGTPTASAVFLGIVALWIVLNLSLSALGVHAVDTPPFEWLELAVSISAVMMTIVILASGARAERLASRREQLMLQLAFLSDHRQAKIIALLEELRHDDPLIKDRRDHQAEAMTQTTDPKDILDAIKQTRKALLSDDDPGKR